MDFVADPTSSPVVSRNSPAKVAAITAAICLVVALVANSAGSLGQAAHQQPSTQREDPGRYVPWMDSEMTGNESRSLSGTTSGLVGSTTVQLPVARPFVSSQGQILASPPMSQPRVVGVVAAAPPSAAFVQRSGTQLTLGGRPYRFIGFNIYGANSVDNCWYTMGRGSQLDQALDDIGPGQNVFRAWFYQPLATRNGVRDWSAFDHTLEVAARHGQRVIATLADQWGDCESPDGGLFKTEEWYVSGYRDARTNPHVPLSYRDWVAEIATRYRDNPTIAVWQLMNEAEDPPAKGSPCTPSAGATLKRWADDVAGLIKRIDRHHLVSLGTIGSGQCGSAGEDYELVHSGPDLDLCEYHDYGSPDVPMPGDQWNGLRVRLLQSRKLNKPLFVGEIGITTAEAGSTAGRARLLQRKLREQFSEGIVGALIWDWRNADEGGSSATEFEVGPGDPVLSLLAGF